jgi:hypothetical protein
MEVKTELLQLSEKAILHYSIFALLRLLIVSQDRGQFNAISQWISTEETRAVRDGYILDNLVACFYQSFLICRQILDYQTKMAWISLCRQNGARNKVQFHLSFSDCEPDKIEMLKCVRNLFFLKSVHSPVKRPYRLLGTVGD